MDDADMRDPAIGLTPRELERLADEAYGQRNDPDVWVDVVPMIDDSKEGYRIAERLARIFHDTYERLAPKHGWETQASTRAKPWSEVPENNRALMIAVIWELLDDGVIEPGRALDEEPLDDAF